MVWDARIGPLCCGAISRHRTYWYQTLVARRLYLNAALERCRPAWRQELVDRFCSQYERVHASPAYYFELRALAIEKNEILSNQPLEDEDPSQIQRLWPFRWALDELADLPQGEKSTLDAGIGDLFDDVI